MVGPQVQHRERAVRAPGLGHRRRLLARSPPPSALRSTRSPGRKTSGSRRARSATRSAVHGPTPGSASRAPDLRDVSSGVAEPQCAVGDRAGDGDDACGPWRPVTPTVRWRSSASRAASTVGVRERAAVPRAGCPGSRGRRRAGPRRPVPRRATRAGRAPRAPRSRTRRCCPGTRRCGRRGHQRAEHRVVRRAPRHPGAGSASSPTHRRPAARAGRRHPSEPVDGDRGRPERAGRQGHREQERTGRRPGDQRRCTLEPSADATTSSSPGTACATR